MKNTLISSCGLLLIIILSGTKDVHAFSPMHDRHFTRSEPNDIIRAIRAKYLKSLLHEAYNQAYPTITPNNPIEQVKIISFSKKNSLEDESNDMEHNGTPIGYYEVDSKVPESPSYESSSDNSNVNEGGIIDLNGDVNDFKHEEVDRLQNSQNLPEGRLSDVEFAKMKGMKQKHGVRVTKRPEHPNDFVSIQHRSQLQQRATRIGTRVTKRDLSQIVNDPNDKDIFFDALSSMPFPRRVYQTRVALGYPIDEYSLPTTTLEDSNLGEAIENQDRIIKKANFGARVTKKNYFGARVTKKSNFGARVTKKANEGTNLANRYLRTMIIKRPEFGTRVTKRILGTRLTKRPIFSTRVT